MSFKKTKIVLTSDTHYCAQTEAEYRDLFQEIASENPDIISHAGDWIVSNQKQFAAALHIFREIIPDVPTVTSLGNHDFWLGTWIQKRTQVCYLTMLEKHKELFAKYDIQHLNAGVHEIGNLVFAGFDGWYSTPSPNTRDHKFLPYQLQGLPVHLALMRKAREDFDKVLSLINDPAYQHKKKILVSHFPTYTPGYVDDGFIAPTSWHKFVIENFDIAHYGHTHKRVENFQDGKCSINNSGSYYHFDETLKYIVLEV